MDDGCLQLLGWAASLQGGSSGGRLPVVRLHLLPHLAQYRTGMWVAGQASVCDSYRIKLNSINFLFVALEPLYWEAIARLPEGHGGRTETVPRRLEVRILLHHLPHGESSLPAICHQKVSGSDMSEGFIRSEFIYRLEIDTSGIILIMTMMMIFLR